MSFKQKRSILTVIIGLAMITGGLLLSSPAQAASMTKAEKAAKRAEIRATYIQSIHDANTQYRQAVASAIETRRLVTAAAKTSTERIAANRTFIQSITKARLEMTSAKLKARAVYIDALRAINWLHSGSAKSGGEKG